MALQKQIIFPDGVTGEYWKIDKVLPDFITSNTYIEVSLFLNQNARDAGKEPIITKSYSFSGEDAITVQDIIDARDSLDDDDLAKTVGYTKLKTNDDFANCVDC